MARTLLDISHKFAMTNQAYKLVHVSISVTLK